MRPSLQRVCGNSPCCVVWSLEQTVVGVFAEFADSELTAPGDRSEQLQLG
jgi:hypothetical protein